MSNDLPTPCIDSLQEYKDQHIRFRARLSECFTDTLAVHTVHRLTLDDSSGTIEGIIWPPNADLADGLCASAFIEMDAYVTEHGGRLQVHVRWLRHLTPAEIELGTDLLPIRLCPEVAREAFSRLRVLERGLPNGLRSFVRDLLCDERIGVPLLTAKASCKHHHAYEGGLLVHSTEMLDAVSEMMWRESQQDTLSVHVTQVSYLLHDLGKVLGVGKARPTGDNPRRWYRHELRTLALIEPHLDHLWARDARAADGVAYILGWLAEHPNHRDYPEFIGAQIVAHLDQASTATARGRTLSAVTTPVHLCHPAANDDCFDMERVDGF